MKSQSILLLLMFSIAICGCGDSTSQASSAEVTDTPVQIKKPKKPKKPASKVEIFNNVDDLRTALSGNGIGKMRKWWGDEYGWQASSNYYNFGKTSKANGLQNNLAYYLGSDKKDYVETLKLVLNINNMKEKKQGLKEFAKVVGKTFESIGLEMPKDLLTSISKGKELQATNENFTTTLALDKSKIDTWKLIIEARK